MHRTRGPPIGTESVNRTAALGFSTINSKIGKQEKIQFTGSMATVRGEPTIEQGSK